MGLRRAELDRQCAQITAEAEQRVRQAYAKSNADLRVTLAALKTRLLAERTQHTAQIATLRLVPAELRKEPSETAARRSYNGGDAVGAGRGRHSDGLRAT